MSELPKNGDLIKCDRCRACHRLTTGRNKKSGALVLRLLVFNCGGDLRIGAKDGVLVRGLEKVEPVGLSAPASEEHVPGEGIGRYGRRKNR